MVVAEETQAQREAREALEAAAAHGVPVGSDTYKEMLARKAVADGAAAAERRRAGR
jgi:hypothetical protein